MSFLSRAFGRTTPTEPDLDPVRFGGRPTAYRADAFVVPVLVVAYIPLRGGEVDRRATGDVGGRLDDLREHIRRTTAAAVAALENGSTAHGYRDPVALPCLRYEVLESIEFLEPLPAWAKPGHSAPMTDYNAIMQRIDARAWVMDRGVREIWVWGYHGGVVDLWESNMASPFGDISNSDRDATDLPVFDRSYTVYHYNYGRGTSEVIEDHMHQIEAVLRHLDPELFWERFVGKTGEGRCGWAHFPPNGERDYDWSNPRRVETDIEEWTPGGGPKRRLSSRRWGGDSLTWFQYWMQNLPGPENGLKYRGRALSNWWQFIGDWDAAMARRAGLAG